MFSASSLPNRFGAGALPLIAGALALAGCNEIAEEQADEPAAIAEQIAIDTIEPEELSKLLEDKKIRLIDVRTDEEVAEGMIPGAEHIELSKFDPAKLDLSDGREPVLYCRSDRRSGIAAEKLSKFTGKKARHLKGGIEGWKAAKMPIRLY